MTLPLATADIVSQAFRFLERQPPNSLDDDTEEARAAKTQYPIARDQALEACDWSFASTLADLSETSTALISVPVMVDPDLPHVYQLPGTLIRLRDIWPQDARWRIDADGLRCDQPAPLRIRFTARITSERTTPALFQTALALRLAWLLGTRFLTTQSKLSELDAQFRDTIKAAMRLDARTASAARYDGLTEQPDWASEARL